MYIIYAQLVRIYSPICYQMAITKILTTLLSESIETLYQDNLIWGLNYINESCLRFDYIKSKVNHFGGLRFLKTSPTWVLDKQKKKKEENSSKQYHLGG